MKVIITIPAYNEEKTIGRAIDQIRSVMEKTRYDHIIVVYDDGSRDKTISIAKKHGAKVFSNKRNLGLAETFSNEMQACLKLGADVIVHTDADMQYDEKKIPVMIKAIENGYDLVLGSRFKGRIHGMPLSKRIGNRMFSQAISWLTGQRITDCTTGFRAFTRSVAEDVQIINTFTYTHEQIIRAAKHKFRITEVPVDTRKTRESRLFRSNLQYAVKAWVNIFRIYRDFAPIMFFGWIGAILFLLGVVLGLWIVFTWISTGDVGPLPRVILSMLFITAGIQIILFGFLADMLGGKRLR
jgi:glycosyltransferase involved in cell wall biosynthesis